MTKEKQDIFFILGLPRSGTTLLEQMLDAHTQIAVCPEISSGVTMWRLNLSKRVKNQWKSLLMVNYYFNRAKIFKDPIVSCIKNQALRELEWPLKTSDWYSPLIEEYLLEKKARIFGEKTPENTFFIPVLNQVFPDGKYIIILRNPFDIILSICEGMAFFKKKTISNQMLLRFAVIVKRGLHNLYVRKHLANKEHIFVTYEDLIKDPDLILTKICRFLNVDFEPGMKSFQHRKKYLENQEVMKFILGRLDEPLTLSRINRSYTLLSAEQISFLLLYITPEIDHLPYKCPVQPVQIPFSIRVEVYMAKLAFFFRLYLFIEYRNKLRFQIHYYSIRLFRNTPLKKYIFKNIKQIPEDWEALNPHD